MLRREVFTLAAERGGYGETQAREVLEAVAPRYQLEAETLREALYADLPENHRLTALPDFTPDRLVDRYNLAQAQARNGLMEEAERSYRRSLDAATSCGNAISEVEARVRLAAILADRGQQQEALAVTYEALRQQGFPNLKDFGSMKEEIV